MKDTEKTKEQLIEELAELRQRVGEVDITEQKQTEEALREEKDRQHNLEAYIDGTENLDDAERAAIVREIDETTADAYTSATFEEALHVLAQHARLMIGAHQSALSYVPDGDFNVAVHTHSFSQKYKKYNTYDVMPTGEGIWGTIVEQKIPVRMTQQQVESHPRWKDFSDLKDARGLEHPPMLGWLVVPILRQNKAFIGVLQLSDKYEGDFTEADQRLLERLVRVIAPTFDLQYVNRELEQTKETLQKAHDELEQRVKERTTELRKTNEDLQQEIDGRQRREVEVQALQQVRDEIWRMRTGEDMRRFLDGVRESLLMLEIPFRNFGVNLVDVEVEEPCVQFYSMNADGDWESTKGDGHAANIVTQIWRQKNVAYRENLEAEDPYGEFLPETLPGPRMRSVIDVPFAQGTLAVSSPDSAAFSTKDIAHLKTLAQVLSEGFLRIEDLHTLEQRSRELEEEITERKQAEERLQKMGNHLVEQLTELEQLYATAPVGLALMDRDLCFVRINERLAAIDGQSVDEHIGRNIRAIVPEIAEKVEPLYHYVIESGEAILNSEVHGAVPAEPEVERYWLASYYPLKSDDGSVSGVNVIVQDITEQKRLEEQLRQSQKMEAVGQLTAGIAHNFNNRLMVISTAIESLQLTETFDPVELEIAASSIEQAAKMVTQLMLFSRSEGGDEFKPIQVREILSDVGEIGYKSFDRKIALIDRIPRDLPLVSGDSTQCEQVFLNLLLNARDAVEASNVSSPSIQMEVKVVSFEEEALPADLLLRQGDYLRIDVIDNGIGMDEETQAHLFEPFFTTKEVGKGTGLGLATVYGIITKHKGWIEYKSQVGVGTTFSVYLPVAEQEDVPLESESSEDIPRGTETLLIIEDEEEVLNPMVSRMSDSGYQILVSRDGQEGWEVFQREQERIDLVILDLSMPNLSGQEVLERMLTLNPDVKVIVSTGYTQHSADALGAKALLEKPYHMAQALQTIRQVLDS